MLGLARKSIVLMIGDDGVFVVPHKIARPRAFFAPTDAFAATREIMDFIDKYPRARITLCADNLAQDYRSDDIPRLNILDRAKLIARRLKQIFPSARLTANLNLKHQKNRALMIGLHESNAVFAWAERLRARLPTIVLLPVEGAPMIAKLMKNSGDWAMMITRQKTGGLRQIVTYKKDMIFTRLTPLPATDDNNSLAEIIAGDIKASLDYLNRLGLRDAQELSVLLVMQEDLDGAEAFRKLSLRSVASLSPVSAARQLGLPLKPDIGDLHADILFAAHLLGRVRPVLPLMLPEAKEKRQELTIRKWGLRVACIAFLCACFSAAWQAENLTDTLYKTQKEALALYKLRGELADMQQNAAPLTEPLGRMRQALARRHIYEQKMPTPWAGLNELAGGFGAEAKLVKLDWKKDGDTAPDIMTVTLALPQNDPAEDRAAIVARFTRVAQNIAAKMPDYQIIETKPPFPDLPQQQVSQEKDDTAKQPLGDITLQRKTP